MLIRKVFGTAGARVFTALMAMLVMIVSTRAFGDDGYGVITMIMLSIMFIGMFNDLIGGAALVYIIPRYKLSEVLTLAYLWSLFTATAGAVILYFYDGDVAGPYVHHVFFIALIYNLFSVNLKSLLGLERIAVFNVFNVLQVLFLLITLLILVFLIPGVDIVLYLYALYVSYGICFLGTLAYIISYNGMIRPVFNPNIIKQISRLGVYTQMANIAQFLNYRLTYFFIKSFWLSPGQSTAPLGVYGAMNKLVDGNWLISKSLSLVQYSVLSNREEETYAQKLTLAFVKFSLIITALITAALIVLPGSFYQWLLGGESFSQIPRLILIFSPGILAMSVNNILAHYFAAKGLQKINAMVSLLGLVITVVAGLLLIPAYGLPGAAYTSSIAHTASTIMIIALFLSRTKLHLSAFLISKSDITLAKNLVWSFRKNK